MCCARSSSARTRTVSPTTAGPGLGRDEHLLLRELRTRKFRAKTGAALPRTADWDDPVYREWIMWNYARRIEIWELNNRMTRAAGGPDCIWSGMNERLGHRAGALVPRSPGDLQRAPTS